MSDAIFRELTARGRGAISVIEVTGSQSLGVVESCFKSAANKPLAELTDRSIIYGRWKSTDEDLVVVLVGAETIEVHCHGGPAIVEAIKSDLSSTGAAPGTSTGGIAGQPDLSFAAETQIAIQQCRTRRTATHLLNLHELWLDIDAGQAPTAEVASEALKWTNFGRHLVEPWNVVLCGPPNAGKSSLINALSGFERAIVHDAPGTTRDVIQQQTAFDGWPVVLSDTAGIRESTNDIEREGVKRAKAQIENADLVLFVFDITDEPSKVQEFLARANRTGGPQLVVFNKIDLRGQGGHDFQTSGPVVSVSATDRTGLDELQSLISELIIPQLPQSKVPVPVSERQLAYLQQVARA